MRIPKFVATAIAVLIAAITAATARAWVGAAPPAYAWARDATLIVTGRVETVGARACTLRITRTLAGTTDGDTISFTPATLEGCTGPGSPAVAPGDEVALFLVKGTGAEFRAVGGGASIVGLGARNQSALTKSTLKSVEYLVAAMRTADLDVRDRAMLAAATDDEQFLRRAACRYIRDDLGVASPAARMQADEDDLDSGTENREAAPKQAHYAAVRKVSAELAALVRIERGSEPSGAALAALADARCAPEGAFDDLVKFARAVRKLDRYEELESACRVIACYDRADAVDVVVELAGALPRLLSALGQSDRPEARAKLLATLHGNDDALIAAATIGLADRLERGRDDEIEGALFARLTEKTGPQMHEVISLALMRSRALDVADALLDRLAAEPLSKEAEDAAAQALHKYVATQPPIPGLRKLVAERQDVLIRRLDSGKTLSVWPLYTLRAIATVEGRAAIRKAASSHPDPRMRGEAARFMDPIGK